MSPRALWWRLAGAVALSLVLVVVLHLLESEPHPVRLTLLVMVGVAALGLFVDGLADDGAGWQVHPVRWATPPGQDHRFSTYLRTLESHLDADVPDGTLRDRLAGLADRVLDQRHGVRRGDPRADSLLGPELTAVLDGPPRRLSRPEIDRCVRRIEEL